MDVRYIKNTERQRIDTLNFSCWRRLLRVPWTAKKSNQSVLMEINPEYSFEWLMLKLKFQYFVHLMWRADSLKKTLMLGKVKGRRKREQQRMTSVTQWTWVWTDSGRQWKTAKPGMLQSVESQRVRCNWVTEQQQHKKLTYVILEVERSSRSTPLAGDPEELMGVSSILEAGVFRIQEESIFLFEFKEGKILVFHLK